MSSIDAQACPKCGGQGFVAKPPWVPGDQHSWPATDTGSYSCPVCHGAKIVARALVGDSALVAERDEARERGDYWRDERERTGELLVAAEAERDRARRERVKSAYAAKVAEARVTELEAALRVIQDYYESVYAPGDQAYQAAIVCRAALAKEDTDE